MSCNSLSTLNGIVNWQYCYDVDKKIINKIYIHLSVEDLKTLRLVSSFFRKLTDEIGKNILYRSYASQQNGFECDIEKITFPTLLHEVNHSIEQTNAGDLGLLPENVNLMIFEYLSARAKISLFLTSKFLKNMITRFLASENARALNKQAEEKAKKWGFVLDAKSSLSNHEQMQDYEKFCQQQLNILYKRLTARSIPFFRCSPSQNPLVYIVTHGVTKRVNVLDLIEAFINKGIDLNNLSGPSFHEIIFIDCYSKLTTMGYLKDENSIKEFALFYANFFNVYSALLDLGLNPSTESQIVDMESLTNDLNYPETLAYKSFLPLEIIVQFYYSFQLGNSVNNFLVLVDPSFQKLVKAIIDKTGKEVYQNRECLPGKCTALEIIQLMQRHLSHLPNSDEMAQKIAQEPDIVVVGEDIESVTEKDIENMFQRAQALAEHREEQRKREIEAAVNQKADFSCALI